MRLGEPAFLVLTTLARGPLHGYAMLKELEALSEGRVRLRTSSLYACLERLATDGLIEQSGSEVVDGRLRRLFTLTLLGRQVLADEARRMKASAAEAVRRLKTSKA